MMRRMVRYSGLSQAIFYTASCCPLCNEWRIIPERGAVYRRSRRSLTMRCRGCGLQWTITYHMLVRAAERVLPELSPASQELMTRYLAQLRPWAKAAGERRGIRKRAGGALEEAAG